MKTQNKVALITGANRGIGLEIARQLGKLGITVVVSARGQTKASEAAAELCGEGIDAHAVKLDVTDSADVAALPAYFREKFGRLDILINNAGVALDSPGPATVDTLRATFETNTIAPYAIIRILLPLLRESPAGRIVNHSSILGSLATVSSGAAGDWATPGYTSSKAALNMLTVVMALELKGTNIKVNSAHPGWVQSGIGGENAPLSAAEGARTAVTLATLPDNGPSGGFFHLDEILPW